MTHAKVPLKSILLMVRASLAFSVMALCVKLTSPGLPSMEIVFFRSLLSVVLLVPLMHHRKTSFLGRHRAKLLARGLFGFVALSLHFFTIGRMPLGTAVMLNYTAPLFVVLLSWIFLGEKPRLRLILLVLTCFTGVYLLLSGDAGAWNRDAVFGLLSAIFAAGAYITISALRDRESPLTIIFYFTLVSTFGSLPFLYKHFLWPSPHEAFLLLGVGAGAFLGQYWMTRALREAPASVLSPFSYLTPVFSFLYGVWLWKEPLGSVSMTGILLILGGGCLLTIWETGEKKLDPVSE